MKSNRIGMIMIFVPLSAGCDFFSSGFPALSDGIYTMESSIKKTGVERNYGGVSQCRITVRGSSIRIEPLDEPVRAWYEGTITGCHVLLSVHLQNPDPMFEAMQLRQTWEGDVTARDCVQGRMKGYAGTNNYLNGTWTLRKTE